MDKKMPGPAPKRGERLTQVSTRIPISLKARLVEQAAAEGRPASDLMVEALEARLGSGEVGFLAQSQVRHGDCADRSA